MLLLLCLCRVLPVLWPLQRSAAHITQRTPHPPLQQQPPPERPLLLLLAVLVVLGCVPQVVRLQAQAASLL